MKQNPKVWVPAVSIVIAAIAGFGFMKSNDAVDGQMIGQQASSAVVATTDSQTGDIVNDYQKEVLKNAVDWMKSAMAINDNPNMAQEQKVNELVALLKKHSNDPEAVHDILVSLSALNPIDAIDDILPLLQSPNENVRNAALGALNNASMLTDQELAQRKQSPENDLKRAEIGKAVNQLLEDPDLTKSTKEVVLSNYAATNPSIADTKAMINQVMHGDTVSQNGANYLASTVLNGKDLDSTLKGLNTKNQAYKSAVVNEVSNNIVANPMILEVLDPNAKKAILEMLQGNPPMTRSGDFESQNDTWKLAIYNLGG